MHAHDGECVRHMCGFFPMSMKHTHTLTHYLYRVVVKGDPEQNALYRNDGRGGFDRVNAEGPGASGASTVVAAGPLIRILIHIRTYIHQHLLQN